jgi:NADH oxidoreductase Hcr
LWRDADYVDAVAWLAKYRPQANVQVIFSVRSPEDVIFAEEWRNYPVTLVAEHNATHGFVAGRLSRELLQSVPDIANRIVMTCGPAPYMEIVEKEVKALGVTRFFKEQFFTPVAEAATSGMKFTKLQPAQTFFGRVGTTLLDRWKATTYRWQRPVAPGCAVAVRPKWFPVSTRSPAP